MSHYMRYGSPRRKEGDKEKWNLMWREKWHKNFPNLRKEMDIKFQEAQKIPIKMN